VTTTSTTTDSPSSAEPKTTEGIPETTRYQLELDMDHHMIILDHQTLEVSDVDLNQDLLVPDHCNPKTVRNLFWNWTREGEEAIQVCPHGSSGFARWRCGSDGMWSTPAPTLGECQSQWLSRLESKFGSAGGSTQNLLDLANELKISTEMKNLFGGDLIIIGKILQSLSQKLRQALQVIPQQSERETFSFEIFQSVLAITSNLLNLDQKFAWEDLDNIKRVAAATATLVALEDHALLLAESINREQSISQSANNVISSVRVLRTKGMEDQVFTDDVSNALALDVTAMVENSINGASRLAFFLIDNLDYILQGKIVNSKVMGVVGSKARFADISDSPAVVTLSHLEEVNGNSVCGVWDYNNKLWSLRECEMVGSNSTHSTCSCTRFGLYAILVEEALTSTFSNYKIRQEIVETMQKSSHLTAAIICAVTLFLCFVLAVVGVLIYRKWDIRPLLRINNIPCFHCKKEEASGGSSGLYPVLTSSPTSTTVSGDTPTGGMCSSNYLVQILEQQAETMKQVRSPITSGKNQTSKTIGSRGQLVQTGHGKNLFRPVSPYGHHIYMEIDPVYTPQVADSDFQLSDISDDDLKRFSDNSRASSNRYGEDRPLIRVGQLRNEPHNEDPLRHCFTTQRQPLTGQRGAQVATLSAACSHLHQQTLRSHCNLLSQNQRLSHQRLYKQASAAQALDTPITIALQGGDQFVSLQIGDLIDDNFKTQGPSYIPYNIQNNNFH